MPGVTSRLLRSLLGSTRASAASTARSDQSSFGFGLVRRSTATSWRSASISASLDAEDRASNESRDTIVTSSRYASGISTSADHADPEDAGQTGWQVLDQHRVTRCAGTGMMFGSSVGARKGRAVQWALPCCSARFIRRAGARGGVGQARSSGRCTLRVRFVRSVRRRRSGGDTRVRSGDFDGLGFERRRTRRRAERPGLRAV